MFNYGFWPLVHLAIVVYVVIQILGSSVENVEKILWIIVVAVLPVAGLIIWFFMGPGSPKKSN